jgi:hypothetical protein
LQYALPTAKVLCRSQRTARPFRKVQLDYIE